LKQTACLAQAINTTKNSIDDAEAIVDQINLFAINQRIKPQSLPVD
jgi:hypothetical protein